MTESTLAERDGVMSSQPSAEQESVVVIINHRSGASDKEDLASKVSDYLTSHGRRCRVEMVRTGAELTAAAARAAAGDAGLVVAGGGDGTIAAVAAALLDTGKTLGVLPLGTFNYFARSIGVPLEVDAALDVLVTGAIRRIGVGEVNGRVFLNNSSIGLYPAVLQQREAAYRQLGRSRVTSYISAALVLVQRPAFLRLQLTADGTVLVRRTPLLFVGANATQMESFAIPGGDYLRSGRLAVCIAQPLDVARLWRVALRAFFRGLYGAEELEVTGAREVVVSLRHRRISVAMDGEIAMLETPLRYRLRPDSLTVMAGVSLDAASTG